MAGYGSKPGTHGSKTRPDELIHPLFYCYRFQLPSLQVDNLSCDR
jgi:hypothetical protein